MVENKPGLFQRLLGWGGGSKRLADDVSLEQSKNSIVVVNPTPIGSSGTRAFSGYTREEYLEVLYGRFAAEKYDEMRRSETQIKMCLSAVKNPIRGAHWEVEPHDTTDSLSVYQAELMSHMLFHDLDKPWSKTIGEILTVCDFGHSVFEITDKVVIGHKKFKNYNGIRSLGWRSPKTLERWNLDPDTGKLISVVQYAYGDLQRLVEIPADFTMIFALDQEGDNYEGISLLRPCYGPWLRKQTFLKLNAIGVEKLAIPTPVAKVPEGKENSKQYQNLIAALQSWTTHQKNYLTLPAGWEVDFKTSDYDPEKVQHAIDAENKEIVKAFMANFLELGMSGPGGSYALSYNQADFFLGGIEYIAQMICDEINTVLIPRMMKLNFGPQEFYPKLKFSGISDKAGKELAESLKALADGAVIIPDDDLEDHIRKRYQLSKRSQKGQRIPKQAQGGALPTDVVTDNKAAAAAAAASGQDDQPKQTTAASEEGVPGRKKGAWTPEEDTPEHEAQTYPGYSIDREQLKIGTAVEMRRTHNAKAAKAIAVDRLTKDKGYYLDHPATYLAEDVTSFQLADQKNKTRDLMVDGKTLLKSVMQENLRNIADDLIGQVIGKAKKLPPSQRLDAIKSYDLRGTRAYSGNLKGALARLATQAIDGARKEIPSKRNIKLAEDEWNFSLAEYDRLPAELRAKIDAQVQLYIDTQGADLEKATTFQFLHNQDSTDDFDILEKDLEEAAQKYIEGPSVEVGSQNAASFVINEARWAFFSDDQVSDEIESYTFTNSNPVSPICEDLAGTTFAADDPEAFRYFPPLHHNCKSYLSPNRKGSEAKGRTADDIESLKPSDPDLDEYVTLSEGKQCGHGHAKATLLPTEKRLSKKSRTRKLGAKKDPKASKIAQLIGEGYDEKQAVAIAYNEERKGKI